MEGTRKRSQLNVVFTAEHVFTPERKSLLSAQAYSGCCLFTLSETSDVRVCIFAGNGLIDFNEFVALMENRAQRISEDAEMRAYFAAFDKDHNG